MMKNRDDVLKQLGINKDDEKPRFVKRCKAFETCESRKRKNCVGCNIWNYLYNIKELQKWCKEHGKDFMLFTMEMHRQLKEDCND